MGGNYSLFTRQMQGIVGRAFARIVNSKLVNDVLDTCSNDFIVNIAVVLVVCQQPLKYTKHCGHESHGGTGQLLTFSPQ